MHKTVLIQTALMSLMVIPIPTRMAVILLMNPQLAQIQIVQMKRTATNIRTIILPNQQHVQIQIVQMIRTVTNIRMIILQRRQLMQELEHMCIEHGGRFIQPDSSRCCNTYLSSGVSRKRKGKVVPA
mmetsp:Transcript_5236/g.8820  ORF Transcript_5236/g.8820 Transcript_5236/m.8820 type:complete len:127 (+) Transcript_5236:406-786(+)